MSGQQQGPRVGMNVPIIGQGRNQAQDVDFKYVPGLCARPINFDGEINGQPCAGAYGGYTKIEDLTFQLFRSWSRPEDDVETRENLIKEAHAAACGVLRISVMSDLEMILSRGQNIAQVNEILIFLQQHPYYSMLLKDEEFEPLAEARRKQLAA